MKLVSIILLVASLAATQAAPHHGNFLTAEEMIAYVESIELALPKFDASSSNMSRVKFGLPPDNKQEGYVVGGGITAFTEKVSGQAKQDILDATLFAQLASDKQYDRDRAPTDWYKYYVNVLNNIGFNIQGFNFVEYNSNGKAFSMDAVVVQILAAIATGGQSLVVSSTLAALDGLANDDDRIKLFGEQSSSYTSGNFQIYPCDQASSGEVQIALGAFYFTTSQKRTDFLFFRYESSNIHLDTNAQSAVLNSAVYSKVRSSISSKLGDNAERFVLAIEL